MKKRIVLAFLSLVLLVFFYFFPFRITLALATDNLTQLVNPFIGTAHDNSPWHDSGDTFPGAVAPMGVIQWSPDTPTKQPGGYYYGDGSIRGFSLTHFSGRGCNVYEDFSFMPTVGSITSSPGNMSKFTTSFSHANESASPGYYKVMLGSKILTELTASQHVGVGQFTYPSSKNAVMLIDTASSINGVSNSSVTISPSNNQITGSVTSKVGCGNQSYTVYFAAVFDRPFAGFGVWNGSTLKANGTNMSGSQTGAYLSFDTTTNQIVHVKVSVSSVSTDNALNNLTEIGSNDFAAVKSATDTLWNTKLHLIEVTGGTTDQQTVFYTALYHVLIHPNIYNDVNGQYMGFDNKVHTVATGHNHYTNIPGWDEYRSDARLIPLLIPSETSDIAQSLIDDATQSDGHLPRWVQANKDSLGMIGDSADVYIASAYIFGAKNFDTKTALQQMLQGQKNIREGLNDYTSLGYVAAGTSKDSAAMTLEYNNDDYAIAQFAAAFGDTQTHDTYIKRSNSWTKLFTNGYIQPKNSNGSFASSSPTSGSGFREGDSAQYTWMVPFDLPTLFSKLGGNSKAISRLDTFFTKLNDGPNSNYAFMGNEPSFEVPWEYNFADAAYKTQKVLRDIQLQLFTNTPGGLPGNDDAGATSSWYIFSALGMYPEIPGADGFSLGSPMFSNVLFHLGNGSTLQIIGENAGDKNPYVQSLTINGINDTSSWLPYPLIANGGSLHFVLGQNPNTSWGTGTAPSGSGDQSIINLAVQLPAIGLGNFMNIPIHTSRSATIYLYTPNQNPSNPSDTPIIKKGTVTFDSNKSSATAGDFINTSFGVGPLSGNYQIFIKLNQYLRKQLVVSGSNSTVISLTPGKTVGPLTAMLPAGDIYPPPTTPGDDFGRNTLDIQDFSMMFSCYGDKVCQYKDVVDLNDDGVVDGIDFNLLLRAFLGK